MRRAARQEADDAHRTAAPSTVAVHIYTDAWRSGTGAKRARDWSIATNTYVLHVLSVYAHMDLYMYMYKSRYMYMYM